jgi:DNA repair exonuclease SbcCD ATPase subunit
MSSIRRIIDLARSNLNSLLERAAETADPRRRLATIPDAELEAELARRRSARAAEQKFHDAKARIEDGGGPNGGTAKSGPMPDRAERERAAREREERVRAARKQREQTAREQAARADAERARRASAGSRTGSRTSSSAGSGSAGAGPSWSQPGASRGRDPQLARYYERLEIPYGSDWETIKTAYRKLMRKYHPDLHGNKSAEKQKAATEVAQSLTQAYNELEKSLVGGPNRSR